MSKNIILLSDGTGNGAAKRNKTNVWRLYDALDLHREDQVAFYDDGVGAHKGDIGGKKLGSPVDDGNLDAGGVHNHASRLELAR